ncbi:MAG TPA: glutathione S-transferase N-terminal domain-containing protein [Novosphingobium sp.]|nr:glutathione S-transferase N-terminal domain-containing protein [Novosphingobium sp.]
MIELFTAPTPNGWKASIMLEECGLPYQVRGIDLLKGDQYQPEFLAISPNNRIPAIVDHAPADGGQPLSVFETGAILCYLADKTGQFLPTEPRQRAATLEWLFWQVSGLGPMLGQHGHFKFYAPEPVPYATQRYRAEALRLYGVLDRQLARSEYVAGPDYSIADMACFPWIQTHKAQEIDLAQFPSILRWYHALKQRPGLRRGMDVGRDLIRAAGQGDAEGRKRLFGIDDPTASAPSR